MALEHEHDLVFHKQPFQGSQRRQRRVQKRACRIRGKLQIREWPTLYIFCLFFIVDYTLYAS